MPWTNPETFTAGQTLTAASMNIVSGNARMGNPVYTNEAARDAAITAPEEGMVAYLTAPTVPAATGATYSTAPTGVTTIYNGSVWVCTTPIAAKSQVSGTRANSTYATTLTSDGTAVSVTLVTGTTALIMMDARMTNSAGGQTVHMSVSVSGATTIAAADANGLDLYELGAGQFVGRTLILDALTAGTNTFTLAYRNTGGTVTFAFRDLIVQGIA